MGQADILLNNLSEDDIAAYTATPETEGHIVIGSDRYITVPEELKRIAVQHDHNIETVTFDCPRYWDGRDLSTMKLYVNYTLPNKKPGSYIVETPAIDENDSNIMHFDWVISRDVTEINGTLEISVCAKTVDTDGNETNHWNSEINTEMFISKGMPCVDSVVKQYPDIVTQLLVVADNTNRVASELEDHLKNGDFELGLPIVDESDNGRILRVENGEWCADPLRVYEGGITEELDGETLGDISEALDHIIEIQNSLIGGDGV